MVELKIKINLGNQEDGQDNVIFLRVTVYVIMILDDSIFLIQLQMKMLKTVDKKGKTINTVIFLFITIHLFKCIATLLSIIIENENN